MAAGRQTITRARYVIREGSRGGERYLAQGNDPGLLLDMQARLERDTAYRIDVIDTEATDPPETGEMVRCPECGAPVLASRIDV